MPYIVSRSAGSQNGSIQIHDLLINKSRANLVNDPPAQSPVHVRVPVWGVSVGQIPTLRSSNNGADVSFASPAYGVLAYILRRVENGVGGALSVDDAIGITIGIKGLVEAGAVINLAAINGLVPLDFDGNGSNSTGDIEELVRIIAGESYTVPYGTSIQAANALVAVLADDFFGNDVKRLVENDLSWRTSLQAGALRGFVNNQAITLYESDGTLTAV